ncbi:histidine-containing phosphotransfer protein 4-like, partial [Carica papaya]|uniref:histidine-containing phosphotransfer protein 4-like n=1 Tax=Carica papaya TaxID=3649 RepID=UPI000B8CC419
GMLDKHFVYLENLADDQNPNVVVEVFELYFADFPAILHKIEHAIDTSDYDYEDMDRCINRLRSSTASVGAIGVLRELNRIDSFWKDQDLRGAKEVLPLLLREYNELKSRLQMYFEVGYLVRGGASSSEARPESPREETNPSSAPASPGSSTN